MKTAERRIGRFGRREPPEGPLGSDIIIPDADPEYDTPIMKPATRFEIYKHKLKETAESFEREIRVYRLILADPRTPRKAKLLLWLALGYAMLPFDLIPDFIPVIGQLDDLIIIPALVLLAIRYIPKKVIAECRQRECVVGLRRTPSPRPRA